MGETGDYQQRLARLWRTESLIYMMLIGVVVSMAKDRVEGVWEKVHGMEIRRIIHDFFFSSLPLCLA